MPSSKTRAVFLCQYLWLRKGGTDSTRSLKCPEPGSNRYGLPHRCLRPARLPIPPSGQMRKVKQIFSSRQIFAGNREPGIGNRESECSDNPVSSENSESSDSPASSESSECSDSPAPSEDSDNLAPSENSENSESSDKPASSECSEGSNFPAPHAQKKSSGGLGSSEDGGGGYLLFHFRSIIGVARFNFSVRNGKRWSPRAIATLVRLSALPCPARCVGRERVRKRVKQAFNRFALVPCGRACAPERVWVISIARLCTLPYLHLRPIYVIVFDDPRMEILS